MKHKMLFGAAALFIGIIIASKIMPGMAIILVCFLLALLLAFINRREGKRLFPILLFVIFLFGMFEYMVVFKSDSKFEKYSGKNIALQCIVIDHPIERGSYTEYKVKTAALINGSKSYNYKEKLIIRYRGKGSFQFGDLLEVKGEVLKPSEKRNPGDFDFEMYYRSKGINNIIQSESMSLLEENNNNLLAAVLYNSKSKIRNIIYKALPEEQGAVLFGMLTGDKTGIDEASMEAFKKSGIAHILSVSGLHIGFIVLLLTYLLKHIKISDKVKYAIIIIVLAYYILMIGLPTPAVRAFIMLVVLLAGRMLNREYDLLSSASFAMLIILIINPLSIHDPGFIISFSCIYSIALIFEPVKRKLTSVPVFIRDSLALSIAVWLGITPVLAYYFNYISFISILLNLIAVPAAFAITAVGFAGVIVGLLSSYLSLYIFSLDFFVIKLLTAILEWTSDFSLGGMYVPQLPLYMYAVYYLVLLYFVCFYNKLHFVNYRRYYATAMCTMLLMSICIYIVPSNYLKLVFFDVGQGDSSCIITPNKKVILIDSGGGNNNSPFYYNVGKNITVPALLHQGVWSINTIIISHAHDDHMEGLLEVLKVFKVKNIVFPDINYADEDVSENYNEVLELCKKKRVKILYLNAGDSIIPEKRVRMDILSPAINTIKGSSSDVNNNSLVVKLSYNKFDVLFTGDIEKEAEQDLKDKAVGADVLKVAHHGSKTSSLEAFIDAVNPKAAVISVGKNNYGHPSAEVIDRLKDKSEKVFRTDTRGAITVVTDGKSMVIDTMK